METTSRNTDFMDSHFAYTCIGVWLFFFGLLGTVTNVYNVVAFIFVRRYHNAFGYLCIARGLCNIVNLLMFVLYTGPVTISEQLYSNPYLTYVENKLESVAGVGYATIPVLQLGIACNRAIAALLPTLYRRIPAGRFASIFIFGGVSYGAAIQVDDIIRRCEFVYNRSQFSWTFVDCSSELQEYKFFYPTFSITGVTVIINAAVAIKIVIQKVGGKDVAHNARLFWQSLTQELFFVNDLIWQNILSDLIDSKIWKFVSLTFMWELSHTLDGLIFLICDEHLKRPKTLFRSTSSFWSKKSRLASMNGGQTTFISSRII